MTDTTKLAERIEALDGMNNNGDMTILTADIARALGWVRVTPSEAGNKTGHWVAPEDCRDGKPVYCSLHGTEIHRSPPNWLWSLDAAMTLVPKGWEWLKLLRTDGRNHIAVEDTSNREANFGYFSIAATPALALSAAALRAQDATNG